MATPVQKEVIGTLLAPVYFEKTSRSPSSWWIQSAMAMISTASWKMYAFPSRCLRCAHGALHFCFGHTMRTLYVCAQCYEAYNKPNADGNAPSGTVCAVQMSSFQWAARDARTCLHRSNSWKNELVNLAKGAPSPSPFVLFSLFTVRLSKFLLSVYFFATCTVVNRLLLH